MEFEDHSGRTVGEFVLRERIAAGGFGTVYRSDQPLLGREAVVKVLHRRLYRHDVAMQRFLREAQVASRLDHPYAAHVYAFGIEKSDGLAWIAMESVRGVTLTQWLRERGPLPIEQFVPFFDGVAEVVHAAHERGIVHRDLKPSNIMVIERAERLLPKLLDFGVAKLLDGVTLAAAPSSNVLASRDPGATPQLRRAAAQPRDPGLNQLTAVSAAIGSPPYMSPEQWASPLAVGPPADLYGLGIVAFEVLTGRLPFAAETVEEYDALHLSAPVPPLGGDFAPGLDRVFQRALAKAPEARWPSALEFAAALRAELRGRMRERVRSAAQQWQEQSRSDGLLWRGDVFAALERWTRETTATALSEPEASFVAASRRIARRAARKRRLLVVLAAAAVLGVLEYRAALRTRAADAVVTQGEIEQGRSALLHGESAEAVQHLSEAYRRGDRSPSTAFMLARALQPSRAELARFSAIRGRMWWAAFSPDGSAIVTTDDGGVQVWDAQTYRLLHTLPHGGEVYQALYTRDGAQIVTIAVDRVRIWDAQTGVLVRELAATRSDGVSPDLYRGLLSPDGRLIAAIDSGGQAAQVWDANSGVRVAELANDGSGWPSLAFSGDGRYLATSGGDDVRVFDSTTWARVATLAGPGIRSLAFDPSGLRLLTGSIGGDASIWSVPSGARLQRLHEVGEPVDRVVYSHDGAIAALALRDGELQVWDAATIQLRSRANLVHGKILGIEVDPTSALVVAASAEGAVAVFDAVSGMPVAMLEGAGNVVQTAHFDPTSRRVIGASWDGTARLWDATSPYRRWSAPPTATGCGLVRSLEPDRRFIAVACGDHPTRVWDTAHDRMLAELPPATPVDGDFPTAFPAVTAAGDRAAIARGTAVAIYELPSARLLRTAVHGAPVTAVAFAASGHDLVSGATDGSVLLTRDDAEPVALPTYSAAVDAAAILADGRVVAADVHSRLRVYAADGRALIGEIDLGLRVGELRPSSDGRRLVTIPNYAGPAAPPALWDLEQHRLIRQLEGNVGQVFGARFVASGDVLTAGADGTARLFDGATGTPRRVYRGTSGGRVLYDAALSPDGALIVGAAGDGSLRFWAAESGEQLWMMRAHRSHVVGVHFEPDGSIVSRGFAGDIAHWVIPDAAHIIGTE